MKKFVIGVLCGLAVIGAAGAQAQTTTVDISAGPTGWGCTTCFGGLQAPGAQLGALVTRVNQGEPGPLQLTLGPGAYSVTNAATTGNYSGWRVDGGDDWAWNFAIGSDNGDGTANTLEVGAIGGIYGSQAAVANATDVPSYHFDTIINPSTSTADFYDSFSLTKQTTLDFFVIDGYLPDNVGGVALNITPLTAVSAAPEPSAWMLMLAGVGGVGLKLRRRKIGVGSRLEAPLPA